MLAAILGGSGSDSDYVESAKNLPTSPANMPDLAGHMIKMEAMHKVSEGEINAFARPMVIFSHIDKLKILELADAKTGLPENLQYNGATPPVNTQPPPPHSPPEDTSTASADPLPHPHIEARDAALQACAGDLPGVCLLSTDYMLYGFYQD